MTVGELRRLLEGVDDSVPLVTEALDEDGIDDGEYESAFVELRMAVRLARRKREAWDTWLKDAPGSLEGRAGQPRVREAVLLVTR